jgi:hypothetical protein
MEYARRVLGGFFAADGRQIDAGLLATGPDCRFAVVAAKGLSPVNIASLGEILGTGTYEHVLGQSVSGHQEAPSGESGVFAIPATLCDALVASRDLEAVAGRWAATDELRRDRWHTSEALDVLRQLAQLVGARSAGQPVWFWWSL